MPVRWVVSTPWIGWSDERNWTNPAVTEHFRAPCRCASARRRARPLAAVARAPGCCRRPARPAPGSSSRCTTSGGSAPASSSSTATCARARLVVEAGVCACEVDARLAATTAPRALAHACCASADLVLAPSRVGRPGARRQRRRARPARGRRERPPRLDAVRIGPAAGAPAGPSSSATPGPLRVALHRRAQRDEGRRRACSTPLAPLAADAGLDLRISAYGLGEYLDDSPGRLGRRAARSTCSTAVRARRARRGAGRPRRARAAVGHARDPLARHPRGAGRRPPGGVHRHPRPRGGRAPRRQRARRPGRRCRGPGRGARAGSPATAGAARPTCGSARPSRSPSARIDEQVDRARARFEQLLAEPGDAGRAADLRLDAAARRHGDVRDGAVRVRHRGRAAALPRPAPGRGPRPARASAAEVRHYRDPDAARARRRRPTSSSSTACRPRSRCSSSSTPLPAPACPARSTSTTSSSIPTSRDEIPALRLLPPGRGRALARRASAATARRSRRATPTSAAPRCWSSTPPS